MKIISSKLVKHIVYENENNILEEMQNNENEIPLVSWIDYLCQRIVQEVEDESEKLDLIK